MGTKKENLVEWGKEVLVLGGGGAAAVWGAGYLTNGTTWSPAMRGGVAGGAMVVAGAGAATKGYKLIGKTLGVAGFISIAAGLAYQQDLSNLLAQTDAQRTAALTSAATPAITAGAAAGTTANPGGAIGAIPGAMMFI